ncbi:hypothetical protein [Myroides sp.]|uniref:hypothetical protein n=1 Tax=Myroides sp. TaxID=1874736 RepID=UPI0028B0AC57|nr:hypothetical protein [Myroides sp.]
MDSKKGVDFIREHIVYGGLYNPIDTKDFDLFNYFSFFFDIDIINRIKPHLLDSRNDSFGTIDSVQTLNIYCPKCNETTTFESLALDELDSKTWNFIGICQSSQLGNIIEGGDQYAIRLSFEKIFKALNNLSTITRNFVCVHSKSESVKHFFSVSYLINDNKIIKVGQFPSINDITGLNLKKYKKINNDIFLELNKANGLFSHGVGVGSYAYLRRIIEKHIVNKKYETKLLSEGKNEQEVEVCLKNTYFKDKVSLLREELSDLLHGNDKIYGFLSKGIHGLSEDECLEVFPILFDSICIILDEEIERIEKEVKKKELASKLNKLK